MKRLFVVSLVLLTSATWAEAQVTFRNIGGAKRVDEAKTKTVHGVVLDQRGRPIPGARISIRNTKDNTVRTATTDAAGSYSMRGLPPDVDYEVRADYRGVISERKAVSALLDREDNLLNFDLNVAVLDAGAAAAADSGPELQTFDLVKLKASFEMPRGVPAPIPAVLLLHGYGEDRKVWQGFKAQLLERGWAVMSLDLRGHGDSKTKNQRPITASPEWRSNSHEFPQDIDPALDWLKKQARLDSRKIVIVGYDVGANLALVSSGKFVEVRSVVAVKPNLQEALAMAGSAQDFHPKSALVFTGNAAEGTEIAGYLKEPFRQVTLTGTGGTAQLFESKALVDTVFQWLKETY
jgi:dienelactone hydrolase